MNATPDYRYLTLLLATTLVMEGMDSLEGTGYYKQSLKNSARNFLKEIERVVRQDIPLVWGINDPVMYSLMDYQKSIIEKIAKMKPEDAGHINEIVEKYYQNPEQSQAA